MKGFCVRSPVKHAGSAPVLSGSACVSCKLLEVAGRPEDMNIAGFRFHGLQGNPKRWSVRVTGNYRITFGWSGENTLDVDFEDYH
jgi:plasmid maintenance system killer protein